MGKYETGLVTIAYQKPKVTVKKVGK